VSKFEKAAISATASKNGYDVHGLGDQGARYRNHRLLDELFEPA
jgi:hypothetical protein